MFIFIEQTEYINSSQGNYFVWEKKRSKVEPTISIGDASAAPIPEVSNESEQKVAESEEQLDDRLIYVPDEGNKEAFGHIKEARTGEHYEPFADEIYFRSISLGMQARSENGNSHFRRSIHGLAKFEKPDLGEYRISRFGDKGYYKEIRFSVWEILEEDILKVSEARPEWIMSEVDSPQAYFCASRGYGFGFEAHLHREHFDEIQSAIRDTKDPEFCFSFPLWGTMGYLSPFSPEGYWYRGRPIKYFDRKTPIENNAEIPPRFWDDGDELAFRSDRNKIDWDGLSLNVRDKNLITVPKLFCDDPNQSENSSSES